MTAAPSPTFVEASDVTPTAPQGLPLLLVAVAGTAVVVAGAAHAAELKRRRSATAG